MYAKLINGALRRAPNKITHNNRIVFNPPEEILEELGYYPVIYTDAPMDAPEGQHYEPSWVQGEAEITQIWNLVDDPEVPEPELSAAETLNIIMGVVQ